MRVSIATVLETIIKRESAGMSLVGPWWRVRVGAIPAGIPPHAVLFRLLLEDFDPPPPTVGTLQLLDPEGTVLATGVAKLEIARIEDLAAVDVHGKAGEGTVTTSRAGVHRWELLLDGRPVAAALFLVSLQNRPAIDA